MKLFLLTLFLCLQPTDDYDSLCELMNNYLITGTTQIPSRGRGQQNSKRNDRFVDRDDEPLEPVCFLSFSSSNKV